MTNIGAFLVYSALVNGSPGCLPVGNSQITAAEIAAALPGLPSAKGDVSLGHAPEPGYVRWWRGNELKQLATRFGLNFTDLHDFCVKREANYYTIDDVLAALRAAVPEGVQLQVADYRRALVPKGRLHFDWRTIASSVCEGRRPEIVWRGRALFPTNRSVPFWARVRVFTDRVRVFAARDIPAGVVLKAADLRQERARGFPLCAGFVDSSAGAEGMESVRRIRAGVTIQVTDLRQPYDILNGEWIHVEAASDSTRLQFTARAIGRGRRGESILVQDTAHRRVFRARVTGRKTANVQMEVLVASKPNRAVMDPADTHTDPSVPR